MDIREAMNIILAKPEPAMLWQLRAGLLEHGLGRGDDILAILDEFYEFLNQLVASSTARQFSHFASILDMAAIGGVAIQNLVDLEDSHDWWKRLVTGALSETMMVLAARQYVKAWEEEMVATYNAAAWFLSGQFWHISVELRPNLPPGDRRQLVQKLTATANNATVDGTLRAGMIIRLFQVLILTQLAQIGGN